MLSFNDKLFNFQLDQVSYSLFDYLSEYEINAKWKLSNDIIIHIEKCFFSFLLFLLFKLKKCRFCTTFKNMCREEEETKREEWGAMACITKKKVYPMEELYWVRLFCVCHVKWRKTFCLDHKRVVSGKQANWTRMLWMEIKIQ